MQQDVFVKRYAPFGIHVSKNVFKSKVIVKVIRSSTGVSFERFRMPQEALSHSENCLRTPKVAFRSPEICFSHSIICISHSKHYTLYTLEMTFRIIKTKYFALGKQSLVL